VTTLLEGLDDRAGEWLEQQVIAHHRRRLGRIGQLGVLDASAGGWAGTGTPPRGGNDVELFVDGAEALPRIAEAIESAHSSVWLAGWFFSADFRLGDGGETLRPLLARVAERADVCVLAWAGAPLPLFHPDRDDVRLACDRLVSGTQIRMALDARERPMHCHHEKLVIVDGEIAFVGGIDLTSYAGNRLDTSMHLPRGAIGWHDATSRVRGPAVADVADHFRLRWHEVTGETLPEVPSPPARGNVELQVVRTVPERIYGALPKGEFGILESYLRALRGAERLIYLENQFLWSGEIVAVLADKLRHPPDDRFRVLVLLPAKPNNGADDTRGQLGVLVSADGGAGRFLACTLFQPGDGARPVYVHAKIGIVDDRWLTLGSANLNEHSLFNDTEMNVVAHDPSLAKALRIRLWSEHLGCSAEEVDGDPAGVFDERWRPLAERGLERRSNGEPLTHRLLRLPHVSHRSRGIWGPINGLFVDG
jgi:phosphatidylserine/phosphatidylglycerophosphate/cardiolipin synthase-like enzyme